LNIIRKAYEAVAAAWYQRNWYYRLAQLYGAGSSTDAGVVVTVETAMRCGPVAACTRAICSPIASMPLPAMRKDGVRTILEPNSRLHRILNLQPNEFQTPQKWREVMLHWALNYGNAYAKVMRAANMGEPVALIPIHPSMLIKKDIVRGEPVYLFRVNNKEERYGNREIFHLQGHSEDGLIGIGAVELGKESIGRAMAMEAYGGTFFGRGGVRAGLLKRTMPFADSTAQERFEDEWQKKYRNGKDSFHRNILLVANSKGHDGWEWEGIGSQPSEAQLVEQSRAVVADICRFYGVSPTLVQDLTQAHYNNLEHENRAHLTGVLTKWMTAFEQEAYRILLTDTQKAAGWAVKHDASGFLRGDFKSMLEAIAAALEKGLITINEGREMIDFDPMDGADALYIQLNRQTVPGTGTPTAAEAASIAKVNAGVDTNAQ
jgi:HK97 family phage portal protein